MIIKNIFTFAYFLFILGVLAYIKYPAMLGTIKVYYVLTDSMYPTISRASVIFVRPADEIKNGEIITYKFKNSASEIITHRVVNTEYINDQKVYITKGDNNEFLDPVPVTGKEIIGKVVFTVGNFDIVFKPVVLGLLFYMPIGFVTGKIFCELVKSL